MSAVREESDHRLAGRLATEAGELLIRLRGGSLPAAELRRAGDEASHRFLAEALARARPGDAILSEEGRDDRSRLAADRVWIVDPLDGTREFGEPGRADWAVHVALWQAGDLVAGALALPAVARTLTTGTPAPPPPPPATPIRIVVSRTRPPDFVAGVAADLGAELCELGSAGAKIAAVIEGRAEAYLHGGGQYEWDSAAPVAVARAAGLHASRLDGSPLRYNQPDPWLPDLLVCLPALAGRLLDAVAARA